MSLKKLLGIISVVIIVVFSMMLTTSYAWYSFENASTVFEGMTSNDDVIISYQHGEYINTNIAVPITSTQIDKYSEKNNFSIKVKDSSIESEYLVTISLVDISIDAALQNTNFKVDFYHQSTKVGTYAGNAIGVSGATTKTLGTVTLDNDMINNFELRIYILDDGTNQSTMMNKTFQAKIKIDVVSRLKTTFNEWEDPDIYISSVTIDGEESDYIPTSGYYSMSSSCTKAGNNTLTWDPLSKTITYPGGSNLNDECSLSFTTSTDYPLLSEMPVGSYVKYTGTNGCDGKSCEGQNANYVSDTNMGYCSSSSYQFYVNGWRIGYKENGSAYLVSAGAPECVRTYIDSKSTSTSAQTLSTNYYYGSGYDFDETTGKFSLTGVTSTTMEWSTGYQSIIDNTPYTCKSTSATATCTTMYEVVSFNSSTQGNAYSHTYYDQIVGVPTHLANLNSKALKYCNSKYAKDGVCDSNTTWAMNATDFSKITGSTLSSSSCNNKYSAMNCGYTNDLIDNGGYYWFATPYRASSTNSFNWQPAYRIVSRDDSIYLFGVRPVLYLESSVYVIGGSGTYTDPYVIGI